MDIIHKNQTNIGVLDGDMVELLMEICLITQLQRAKSCANDIKLLNPCNPSKIIAFGTIIKLLQREGCLNLITLYI